MLEEIVPDALDGERVDRVVAMIAGCSRSAAATAIEAGTIRLNGVPVSTRSRRVVTGDLVSIEGNPGAESRPSVEPDADVDISIVHVDPDIVVVDKAPGVVVHPAPGHRGATLVNGLLSRFPELADVGEASGQPGRPGIVHRLDKGTSGLMVVARTIDAYDDLVAQLSSHEVTRRYEALVWGHPAERYGAVEAPIGRSTRNPLKMAVVADGKWALTRYRLRMRFVEPLAALLDVDLETGRTHQIRVHLSRLGHPVVGDDLYGGRRASLDAPRPMLHAAQLALDHPRTGERVEFASSTPADMAAVIAALAVAPDGDQSEPGQLR